jgi:hypothetical protein
MNRQNAATRQCQQLTGMARLLLCVAAAARAQAWGFTQVSDLRLGPAWPAAGYAIE